MDNIIFFECPDCYGYGKKDNGNSCKKCKGSGELMFTKGNGKRIMVTDITKTIKSNKKNVNGKDKNLKEINKRKRMAK